MVPRSWFENQHSRQDPMIIFKKCNIIVSCWALNITLFFKNNKQLLFGYKKSYSDCLRFPAVWRKYEERGNILEGLRTYLATATPPTYSGHIMTSVQISRSPLNFKTQLPKFKFSHLYILSILINHCIIQRLQCDIISSNCNTGPTCCAVKKEVRRKRNTQTQR